MNSLPSGCHWHWQLQVATNLLIYLLCHSILFFAQNSDLFIARLLENVRAWERQNQDFVNDRLRTVFASVRKFRVICFWLITRSVCLMDSYFDDVVAIFPLVMDWCLRVCQQLRANALTAAEISHLPTAIWLCLKLLRFATLFLKFIWLNRAHFFSLQRHLIFWFFHSSMLRGNAIKTAIETIQAATGKAPDASKLNLHAWTAQARTVCDDLFVLSSNRYAVVFHQVAILIGPEFRQLLGILSRLYLFRYFASFWIDLSLVCVVHFIRRICGSNYSVFGVLEHDAGRVVPKCVFVQPHPRHRRPP